MLTDKELRSLQAQHPTENDPMPFARAVIAAYEAKLREQKAFAWHSPTEGLSYENHYSDNQPLFEHPAPSAPLPLKQSKPIYQVWRSTDSCGEFYSWDDCDKYDYDETLGDNRRVLFEHPAPLPEEQIAEIKRKERERCASMVRDCMFRIGQTSPYRKYVKELLEAIRSLED